MARVKMRYSHGRGDEAVMLGIRDDLAGLMTKILDCDSTRHAPLYAAWSAADCCSRLLSEPPHPRRPDGSVEEAPRGRPEREDIALMDRLYRRAQELNVLLHPSAVASAPILAVALAIREAAVAWSGDPHLWRETKGVQMAAEARL